MTTDSERWAMRYKRDNPNKARVLTAATVTIHAVGHAFAQPLNPGKTSKDGKERVKGNQLKKSLKEFANYRGYY